MVATPQPDDVMSRLAALERTVAEISRKTSTNLSVTDPTTQTKILQIDQDAANSNRAHIQIRDSAGDVILSNDTAAGWGYASPNLSYSVFPFNSWAATQITTTGHQTTYQGRFIVNSPRLNIGSDIEVSTGAITGSASYQINWWTVSYSSRTTIATHSFGAGTGYRQAYVNDTYLWPTNMFGSYVWMSFEASLDSGVSSGNWCANTPTSLYGSGQ